MRNPLLPDIRAGRDSVAVRPMIPDDVCGMSAAQSLSGINKREARMTLHIIGNPVSPYVRKIFIALLTKSVAFDFDPITPFLAMTNLPR